MVHKVAWIVGLYLILATLVLACCCCPLPTIQGGKAGKQVAEWLITIMVSLGFSGFKLRSLTAQRTSLPKFFHPSRRRTEIRQGLSGLSILKKTNKSRESHATNLMTTSVFGWQKPRPPPEASPRLLTMKVFDEMDGLGIAPPRVVGLRFYRETHEALGQFFFDTAIWPISYMNLPCDANQGNCCCSLAAFKLKEVFLKPCVEVANCCQISSGYKSVNWSLKA